MSRDQRGGAWQPRSVVDIESSMKLVADPEQQPQKGRRARRASTKERVSKIPSTPGRRSSIYRGVTRHRWTGRYEAHLWDKSCWNQSQNKKGRQVYLGAYDDEEAAARAYDLAALKYWGPGTIINFPLTDYTKALEEMRDVSKEEYLASLRRKSSGFSRGVSKYRGVARHHHNGRWEARIGRIFGNKYLYLGTYSTQEEAAAAYDMAAIEYRGLNAVTNFDLSRYIRWLRPGQAEGVLSPGDPNGMVPSTQTNNSFVAGGLSPTVPVHIQGQMEQSGIWNATQACNGVYNQLTSTMTQEANCKNASGSALGLLSQSGIFKQMLERTTASDAVEEQTSSSAEISSPDQSYCDVDQQSHCNGKQGNGMSSGGIMMMDNMVVDVKPELSFQEEVRHVFDHPEMATMVDQSEDFPFGTSLSLDRMFFQSDMSFPYFPNNPSPAELVDQGGAPLDSLISINSLSLPYAISTCS